MRTILGIDPGMSGALAFYGYGELIIHDMPVLERNKTKRVNAWKLTEIICSTDDVLPEHAFIEQVNAFGMGKTSAFNFGWSCGVVEGVLGSLCIPYTYVTPQTWKKVMSCPADKNSARSRATQLMPQYAHNWDLKKFDGRAEASLIALYGYSRYKNDPVHTQTP